MQRWHLELVGLIIKSPYIEQIISGDKTWEIRGKPTSKRGRVALVKSGARSIVGVCEITDVIGPLTLQTLQRNLDRHRDEKDTQILPYKTTYAWALNNVISFEQPIPFANPSGAVTWVRLPDEIILNIEKSLRR